MSDNYFKEINLNSVTTPISKITNIGGIAAKVTSTKLGTISKDGVEVSRKLKKKASGPKIVAWADGTDEEIAAMLDLHYAGTIDVTDYWKVGDTRQVTGTDGTTANWIIIGLNHDDLADGSGKAAVTIWKSDNWTQTAMNSLRNSYTYANYSTSEGRTNTRALKTNLSSGLQSLVKSVTKTSAYPTDSSNTQALETSTEDLFLLSNYEWFGSLYDSYVTAQDGTQYEYMTSILLTDNNEFWSRSGFWSSGIMASANFVIYRSGSGRTYSDCTYSSIYLAPACCL